MARPPSQGKQGFIWLPRTAPTFWKIYINSIEVTINIFSAEFTKAVCPETGQCRIEIINSDNYFTNLFNYNQLIDLYIDYTSGTTLQFRGKIDTIKNAFQQDKGYVLQIEGSHLTRDLYDIIVTEKITGTMNLQSILNYIIAKYTTGYTLNFTSTNTSSPNIVWDSKTFWDCVSDLVKIANADCFVDDNKTIYFFDKSSRVNNNEAIVWNDTAINLNGLGKQIVTTKNKVQVVGDDGQGLPVLATADNTSSQATYGTKPVVIFDNKISSNSAANDSANANLNATANPNNEGDAEALILPSLKPADLIWISDPSQSIHGQYRIYSFTHKFPNENTMCTINQERSSKQILKAQSNDNLASQALTNPYGCLSSVNYTFLVSTDIASKDSNVLQSVGNVHLSSGTQGVFTTSPVNLSSTASFVHFQATGSNLGLILYELSTDNGTSYQSLNINTLNTLATPGTNFIMRITIQSASAEIYSIALLWK